MFGLVFEVEATMLVLASMVGNTIFLLSTKETKKRNYILVLALNGVVVINWLSVALSV